MAIAAGITAAAALAGLAGTAISATSRNNSQQTQNQSLQAAGLQNQINNQAQEQLIQAMANQRAVAGQTDSYGSSLVYDPTTNSWKSTLGAQPQAAQSAQMQAGITRNTTDVGRAELQNAIAAQRAAVAAPGADAAIRNLASFRPMSADQLTGLLGQQATIAQNQTYRPLVADTLRTFARSGTAAGPVLGQIGKDADTSLRQSLIDAQIKGMTGVGDINTQKQQGLEQAATTASNLATPNFQYPGISTSGVDNTLSTLMAQRAANSGQTALGGMGAENQAAGQTASAYQNLGKSIANPNYGVDQLSSGLGTAAAQFGQGGQANQLGSAIATLYKSFGGGTTPTDPNANSDILGTLKSEGPW